MFPTDMQRHVGDLMRLKIYLERSPREIEMPEEVNPNHKSETPMLQVKNLDI